jgi:hypothetical protein
LQNICRAAPGSDLFSQTSALFRLGGDHEQRAFEIMVQTGQQIRPRSLRDNRGGAVFAKAVNQPAVNWHYVDQFDQFIYFQLFTKCHEDRSETDRPLNIF